MNGNGPPVQSLTDEKWRKWLVNGYTPERRLRRLFGLLPALARCRSCHAPLGGSEVPLSMLFADVCGSTPPWQKKPLHQSLFA